MALVMGRRRVMGSPAGSRQDLREALAFAAEHDVRPRVTRYSLEGAGEALSVMHSRALRGRDGGLNEGLSATGQQPTFAVFT
jgi:D-arabinose 1-dehydrogenase-like Zn-dependent alcohol dehydrogenase